MKDQSTLSESQHYRDVDEALAKSNEDLGKACLHIGNSVAQALMKCDSRATPKARERTDNPPFPCCATCHPNSQVFGSLPFCPINLPYRTSTRKPAHFVVCFSAKCIRGSFPPTRTLMPGAELKRSHSYLEFAYAAACFSWSAVASSMAAFALLCLLQFSFKLRFVFV